MNGTNTSVLTEIDRFLQETKLEKTAAERGETAHPEAKAEDNTTQTVEGARAKENTSDIRKALGNQGIAGQEDADSTPTNAVDAIGTKKMEADEVAGNVGKPKSAPEKPEKKSEGTLESPSHPTNQTFAEKYSSLSKAGNEILADIALFSEGKQAEEAPAAPAVPPLKGKKKTEKKEEGETEVKVEVEPAVKEAEAQLAADAQAGYDAAAAVDNLVKQAAGEQQQAAAQVITHVAKNAESLAHTYCDFLDGLAQGTQNLQKNAADFNQGLQTGAANAIHDVAAKLLAKQADGEGLPPEALAAAGAPGEGAPEMAGAEGGDPNEEQAAEAIAEALNQAGVSPDEFLQLVKQLQEQQGGGEGGVEGGGEAPAEGLGNTGAAAHEAGEAPAEEQMEEEAGTPEKQENKAAALRERAKRLSQAR